MVRRALESIIGSLIRRRRIWTLGVLVVAAIAIWLGSQLTLRLDSRDFLPSTTAPDSVAEEILQEFGGGGRIIVVLAAEEEIDVGEVAQLFDYLSERIQRLEGVQTVQSRLAPELREFLDEHGPDRFFLYLEPNHLKLASYRISKDGIERALLDDAGSRETDPTSLFMKLQGDPLGLVGLASWTVRRVTGTYRVRLLDGYFSLPGARKFFLTVQPEPGMDDIRSAKALVQGIEAVFDDARSDERTAALLNGKQLSAVGRPVSYVYGFETLYGDIRRIAIGAATLVVLLLAFFFRSALAPLVLMLPIAMGFALAAGIGFLLFPSMSLMAWIFIGVLVGLGVDFGIHIATHYWIYGNPGAERSEALLNSVLRPGRGILFGGLTSAAAFFSLQIVSYPAMKQIAWLTGIGLVAILLSSFTVLPLALSHFASGVRSETLWHKWGAFFERASRARPRWAITGWAFLVAATLFAAPSIPVELHPWKLTLRGNPKSAEMERLNEELGSSFTPLLMVSRGATQEEAIARDREAVRAAQRWAMKAGVTSIVSLSRWLPSREHQVANIEFIRENPELFSPARFRRDFEDAVSRMENPDPYLRDEYLPLVSSFLQPDQREVTLADLRGVGLDSLIDRHLLRRGDEHLAISYVYLRRFPWAEGAVSRFLETFDAAGGGDLVGTRILGEALRSSSHAGIIRRDGLLATLLATVLVATILWIQFRDIRRAALCLLPLLCGVSAALLIMAILGIELNMLTLAIAPLIVGIGVDDGIHMVERLSRGEEVGIVLREAGSSMTMTTLTTVGAFACLGLAEFAGIREVGLVGSVGLLVCLLAALHLIPLCFRLLTRSRPD